MPGRSQGEVGSAASGPVEGSGLQGGLGGWGQSCCEGSEVPPRMGLGGPEAPGGGVCGLDTDLPRLQSACSHFSVPVGLF